jgi:8-oxo-dGTP pyrophosphatase MutT (NUDIX family)
LLGAAVRETFEETGVLLTVPAAQLADARADVESGATSFGDLLREHGLTVDADAVRPWSRWVTPPNEVRRYDTRFFVAGLPDGVDPVNVTSESSAASWVPVREAIAQAERGERMMLPPTLFTLTSLLPYAKVADVLAASDARVLDAVRPSIRFVGDDVIAELPDGTSITLPRPPRR